ncbi:MAG: radical SAM protein [Anaerolineales bacterium]|jgi:23S rRNA (adenine2503-C2)-methyltransferase
MKVVASAGHQEIAMVYVVEYPGGLVECVEAIQPPRSREDKWVLMISTLFGCPINCKMCDAGGHYRGKLTEEEMFSQIEYLIGQRYPSGQVPSKQFKIQFARMGEPALNPAVLDLLRSLPGRLQAPGLLPSFSTIAPHGTDDFFEELIDIKDEYYPGGRFQFQFSIHTTDTARRDELIPVRKWDFQKMAAFGERYYQPGDRKITLNFALAEDSPVDPGVLLEYFDPELFLVKITPLNPTYQALASGLKSYVKHKDEISDYPVLQAVEQAGYQLILSIGEQEENRIGSNCGQYVQKHLLENEGLSAGYTYQVDQPVADLE